MEGARTAWKLPSIAPVSWSLHYIVPKSMISKLCRKYTGYATYVISPPCTSRQWWFRASLTPPKRPEVELRNMSLADSIVMSKNHPWEDYAKNWESNRLAPKRIFWASHSWLCVFCCFSKANSKGWVAEGSSWGKVNAMNSFNFYASEVSETEILQNKKNMWPADGVEFKAGWSTCTPHVKRSKQKTKNVIEWRTLHPSGVFRIEFSFTSLSNIDDSGPITLRTEYSSLPDFMASVNEKWLTDICRALHLCLDDKWDRYEASSPFLNLLWSAEDFSPSSFQRGHVLFIRCLV